MSNTESFLHEGTIRITHPTMATLRRTSTRTREKSTSTVIITGTRIEIVFNSRHRAHSRRHGTTSYSHKHSHVSYNDDSEKDDSIGHYLGGKGDVIGEKCTVR